MMDGLRLSRAFAYHNISFRDWLLAWAATKLKVSGRPMEDEMHRNMMMAGVFITLMIGMLAWQVLRIISRGGMDAQGVVRLVCTVFVLGIMCYVGYTALSMWT